MTIISFIILYIDPSKICDYIKGHTKLLEKPHHMRRNITDGMKTLTQLPVSNDTGSGSESESDSESDSDDENTSENLSDTYSENNYKYNLYDELGSLADNKLAHLQKKIGNRNREAMDRMARTDKYTNIGYLTAELNAHANSRWWDDDVELEKEF